LRVEHFFVLLNESNKIRFTKSKKILILCLSKNDLLKISKLIEILFSFHSNVENDQVKLDQICKNSAFVFSNLKMI